MKTNIHPKTCVATEHNSINGIANCFGVVHLCHLPAIPKTVTPITWYNMETIRL